MMDQRVLKQAKADFTIQTKEMSRAKLFTLPTDVVIKMFGKAMLKGLSANSIQESFTACGWFDVAFQAYRFEMYSNSAVTTATASLTAVEGVQTLMEYLIDGVIDTAKASEQQQREADAQQSKRSRRKKTSGKKTGNLGDSANILALASGLESKKKVVLEKTQKIQLPSRLIGGQQLMQK